MSIFPVINHTLNPVVRAVLRSPAHRLASGSLVLLTVTGRRSGRRFTFPVGYRQDGDTVTVAVGWPERKQWWRNLREEAPVGLVLRGVRRSGRAQSHGTPPGAVTVRIELDSARD
jgi:F420H(2)-dependent quinone reductase